MQGPACSGSPPCLQSRTHALPAYFPHYADEETGPQPARGHSAGHAGSSLHTTNKLQWGINIFSPLMLFRKPCESFPNTSIVSVNTFLMRLPLVAKEFACYSRVLINLQTIAPDCLLLWQEDRHCSFGLTFFQICTLSKTEDLAVTSVIRVSLEHATVVAVKKEIDIQEDGQKDSFPRAKYSSK